MIIVVKIGYKLYRYYVNISYKKFFLLKKERKIVLILLFRIFQFLNFSIIVNIQSA